MLLQQNSLHCVRWTDYVSITFKYSYVKCTVLFSQILLWIEIVEWERLLWAQKETKRGRAVQHNKWKPDQWHFSDGIFDVIFWIVYILCRYVQRRRRWSRVNVKERTNDEFNFFILRFPELSLSKTSLDTLLAVSCWRFKTESRFLFWSFFRVYVLVEFLCVFLTECFQSVVLCVNKKQVKEKSPFFWKSKVMINKIN